MRLKKLHSEKRCDVKKRQMFINGRGKIEEQKGEREGEDEGERQ